jgi:hypothetical protein
MPSRRGRDSPARRQPPLPRPLSPRSAGERGERPIRGGRGVAAFRARQVTPSRPGRGYALASVRPVCRGFGVRCGSVFLKMDTPGLRLDPSPRRECSSRSVLLPARRDIPESASRIALDTHGGDLRGSRGPLGRTSPPRSTQLAISTCGRSSCHAAHLRRLRRGRHRPLRGSAENSPHPEACSERIRLVGVHFQKTRSAAHSAAAARRGERWADASPGDARLVRRVGITSRIREPEPL